MTVQLKDGIRSMGKKMPEPQWLDADEQHAWREYLHASRLLESVMDRDLQSHGLQLTEYEIICCLSEAPDRRLRMSAMAEMVAQSRSRLTHTAGRLEKRGWVRREAYVGDRRGVELVLTEAGCAAVVQMAPTHVRSVRANLVDPSRARSSWPSAGPWGPSDLASRTQRSRAWRNARTFASPTSLPEAPGAPVPGQPSVPPQSAARSKLSVRSARYFRRPLLVAIDVRNATRPDGLAT